MSGWLDFLLPLPLYLVLVLMLITAMAWRRPARHRLHRARWLCVGLVAWAWVLSAPSASNELIRAMEGAPAAATETPARDQQTLIVVLASGELRPRLDQSGWERLHGGIRLWQQTDGQLLMAGGPGLSERTSLGAQMVQAARDFGMPARALAYVGGGANTVEDLQSATALVKQHQGPVWLVTSALHMPRALAVTRRLDWPAVRPHRVDYQAVPPLGAAGWLPSNGGPTRMADVLHEIVGRMFYRLKGWSD
ncbi:MAG: YdcF family protein [Burkholderiales bacterium]